MPGERPLQAPARSGGNEARLHPPNTRVSSGLTYRISLEGRPQYWTHTLYRGPDGEKVDLRYCRTLQQSEEVAKKFLNEKVVGFDLEWVAENKRRHVSGIAVKLNVSLIQVASETTSALFHIAMHSGTSTAQLIAPSLRRLIESRSILKVGVNILNADAKRLARNFSLEPGGIVELGHLYRVATRKSVAQRRNGSHAGIVALASITLDHMGLPLSKDKTIRCGRWDQDLTSSQKKYAADDAYVGFHLYVKMNTDRLNMDPVPAHPRIADIEIINGETVTTTRAYRESGEQREDSITGNPSLVSDVQERVVASAVKPIQPNVYYGDNQQRLCEPIEMLDMTCPGSPITILPGPKLHVSESFTTKTGMLCLGESNEDDLNGGVDDSDMTLLPMTEVQYPELPPTQFDENDMPDYIDDSAERPALAVPEKPITLPIRSSLPHPVSQITDPDTRPPDLPETEPGAMTGVTKRLYSALRALQIRLGLTTHPAASDVLLRDIAWVEPRTAYELSLISGAESFVELLDKQGVRLLDFVERHAPRGTA